MRFKRLVATAHGLRVINNTQLTETGCITGFLSGLKREYDVVKIHWQANVSQFASLDAAIKIVKATGQSTIQNKLNATSTAHISNSIAASGSKHSEETGSNRRKVEYSDEARQTRFRPNGDAYSGRRRVPYGRSEQVFVTGEEEDNSVENSYTQGPCKRRQFRQEDRQLETTSKPRASRRRLQTRSQLNPATRELDATTS